MNDQHDRNLLIGKKAGEWGIVGWRKGKAFFYLLLENGMELAFQAHHKNDNILLYINGNQPPTPPHTAFIVGNGPSIQDTDLDLLIGQRSYGTNRVWRLWEEFRPDLKWRPTDYVRLEKGNAKEDINKMSKIGCVMHVQRGAPDADTTARRDYFATCDCLEHGWHLPIICGHGTVVHAAMQIAIREGAERIVLLGCDLGMPLHFYGEEGIDNDPLAYKAHQIAKRDSPVPIYNATKGGQLDIYERISLEEAVRRLGS